MRMLRALSVTLPLASMLMSSACHADDKLSPNDLQIALERHPDMAEGRKLAERVRTWFGEDTLRAGKSVKVDGLTVAWAVEADGFYFTPQVVSEDGTFTQPLTRLGDTNVFVAAQTLPNTAGMVWFYRFDGSRRPDAKRFGGGNLEVYEYPRECFVQPDVPHGTVTEQPQFHSKIFPDTVHDWWIYVPAQYKPDQPVPVMVFQDGGGMKGYVTPVLDNLIAKGQIPVMAAVFINPGYYTDNRIAAGSERSIEYDTLSDRYSKFLIEEILPEVEKTVKLKSDAASRGICGLSSGGICSFTVAWERPDQFTKVVSFVGSFTNIQDGATHREGGHNYPALIRKTEKRPIRVFLQDGENDLDNANGNWPLSNQQMAKSLAFAGYDYKFAFGHGFHSPNHGRYVLPDALRWLWRDYPK